MNDINKRIYRTALENLSSKMKNPRKIREFYWDLIKSKGYTVEKKEVIPVEESTPNQEYSFSEFSEFDYEFENNDYYSQFCKNCNERLIDNQECQVCNIIPHFQKLGYSDSLHSGVILSNTIIDDPGSRMNILNKWINSNDTNRVIRDLIDTVLSELGIDSINIRNDSINNFVNISNYYLTNPLKLKANTGSLRRGYLILAIYYSVKYKRIEEIVPLVDKAKLSDIPEAQKNYRRIFEYLGIEIENEMNIPGSIRNEYTSLLTNLVNKGVFIGNNTEKQSVVDYLLGMKRNDTNAKKIKAFVKNQEY